jgi:hypothetical protein
MKTTLENILTISAKSEIVKSKIKYKHTKITKQEGMELWFSLENKVLEIKIIRIASSRKKLLKAL